MRWRSSRTPATGAPRLAWWLDDDMAKVRVFDPVAGGEALVVIDVGSEVCALAVFADPATGELRLACGCDDGKVRIFDPVAGGEALVVLEGHTDWVRALTVFKTRRRADFASRADRMTVPCASGTWPRAARRCSCSRDTRHSVYALTAFTDPATGETRLASGSCDKTLRVWDASKGGAALRVVPFDDEC